jgi:hypothetical protein
VLSVEHVKAMPVWEIPHRIKQCLRGRWWHAVASGLACWATLTWCASGAASGSLSWSPRRVPHLPGQSSSLAGVSCTSRTACTAVGASEGANSRAALVERWNGSRWSIQSIANLPGTTGSDLSGVSCPSAIACTAVGSYVDESGRVLPLSLRWNGATWLVQSAATPAESTFGAFNSVSCPSPTICEAVGSFDLTNGATVTLAERWQAGRWSLQPTPTLATGDGYESVLQAVSCPAGSACIAVGYTNTGGLRGCDTADLGLIERWNGSRWSMQAAICHQGELSTGFGGVSCPSQMACMAVGSVSATAFSGPAAEWSTGSRWRDVISPYFLTDPFTAVSCPSKSTCIAVGETHEIARWDGHKWSPDTVPTTPDLTGISCVSRARCVAVGTTAAGNGTSLISRPPNNDAQG